MGFLRQSYRKSCVPIPEIFRLRANDPFLYTSAHMKQPQVDVFYVTDRQKNPSGKVGYSNLRDECLRLGRASVCLGPKGKTWDWIMQHTLQSKNPSALSMEVTGIHEFGYLHSSCPPYYFRHSRATNEGEVLEQTKRWVQEVNSSLKASCSKTLYIYVSGFKVCFDDPVLLSRSFWHYMGYDGVFIAYCWPATSGRMSAYAHDLETANYCGRNFRLLLEFLARETDADQIHIIGHSAGSRIVCNVLRDLRLKYHQDDADVLRQKLKLGRVVLLGADFDRMILRSYYRDNVLDIVRKVTIYVSRYDKALVFSRLFFGTTRVGHLHKKGIAPWQLELLRNEQQVEFIDVSRAYLAGRGSGHLYQLTSPWVLADLILCLQYGLTPAQRCLNKEEGGLYWSFDQKYRDKIKSIVLNKL